jgi:hypothetical protein
MVWKLLPQILTVLVVAGAAILDYIWHDKRTKKFRIAMFWLFLLITMLMIFSVVAVLKENKSNAEEKQILRSELASISNSIAASKPYFDLFINNSSNSIPSFSTMHLSKSRKIDITVANSGPGAASHVVVECVLPLDVTNLDYPLWTVFGHPVSKDTMKEENRITVLGAGRDSLASGSAIQASVSISTNIGFPTFSRRELESLRFMLLDSGTNLPMDSPLQMLPAVFTVHSDGTSTRKFVVLFLP